MIVAGNHQTTYSDWARAVISSYPFDLTYKLERVDGNKFADIIHVFHGENEIAYYNFGNGSGGMTDTSERHTIAEMGKWETFTEIDLDKLVRIK